MTEKIRQREADCDQAKKDEEISTRIPWAHAANTANETNSDACSAVQLRGAFCLVRPAVLAPAVSGPPSGYTA